jgi:RNA polymerase sigma-70 factor (ECF subfamily)
MAATDEELVAQVASGDEAALAELLRRFQRPLSHFLYRQTGGQDVEDLYQETWLRVVRAAHRFDRSKRFSTWLFQIAVNLCRDWHRRRLPQSDAVLPSVEAPSLVPIEARLDAARLLAALPEAQREVLILRYYHDLGEAEIAVIAGCPRGTVKSRLHNALQRLAAAVKGKSDENRG